MSAYPNVSPKWLSLQEFCGDCLLSAECPRTTLAEVTSCPLVREQWKQNSESGVHLGPPAPMMGQASFIVRTPSPTRRYKPRRGRRPLNERGVLRLLKKLFVLAPEGEAA